MNSVVLTLTVEEANNLIALINRAQITGAEALPVVLLRQRIEQGIKAHAEMVLARNGTEPEPVES